MVYSVTLVVQAFETVFRRKRGKRTNVSMWWLQSLLFLYVKSLQLLTLFSPAACWPCSVTTLASTLWPVFCFLPWEVGRPCYCWVSQEYGRGPASSDWCGHRQDALCLHQGHSWHRVSAQQIYFLILLKKLSTWQMPTLGRLFCLGTHLFYDLLSLHEMFLMP